MNPLSVICLLLSALLIHAQFQPRTSPNNRRVIFRPMTRNFGIVGRGRGPQAPAPFRNTNGMLVGHRTGSRAPGFKPPVGIAKKLNEAVDFRALARVLLKQ